MRILILGGTVFLGRHIVEAAQERGHEVTLFNRGKTNPGLFSDAELLQGDRDGGLDALEGGRWDAVVDTSGYRPRVVRQSAELLAGAADHYTFISSISVYRDFDAPNMDENAPLGTLDDPTVEEVTGETYGPLKVLCEQVVQEQFPQQALVIRPGLIVGPHDPTDRFTYWPVRVARGGDVLAPGKAALPVQIIDVRDLATWTVQMIEARQTGVYNATGPAEPLTLGDILATSREVSHSTARFVWVDEAFLLEQGVKPWSELPLWYPGGENLASINVEKAVGAGLSFRPLAGTVEDTLEWVGDRGDEYEWRAGLSDEREAELLQAWYAAEAQEVEEDPPK